MSRRARHNSNDLRELFIEATTSLINEHGVAAISARTIARKIGYTAGSLYNVFQDLDDLLVLAEGRQLDRLHAALSETLASHSAEESLQACAKTYLRFCLDNSKLWSLVVVHQTGPGKALPDWYAEKLEALVAVFADAMSPLSLEPAQRAQQARAIWAAVHGTAALIVSGKAPNLAADAAGDLLDSIVATLLKGLRSESSLRARPGKPSAVEVHHLAHGG